ncbi:hypothetical protein B0T22DRAFT_469441 [Podospora appendiculata]|uniref:Pentatricopeptide repeat-containing protein n=1 Tax=Podospora appendiculata TaxID=314037 RepID=A0AAE1C9E0_9PEZI|nr:hypothetical protein B0T22DRAFT_469441 [Podospora appendiculata]
MKVSSQIDGSICGAILSLLPRHRPSPPPPLLSPSARTWWDAEPWAGANARQAGRLYSTGHGGAPARRHRGFCANRHRLDLRAAAETTKRWKSSSLACTRPTAPPFPPIEDGHRSSGLFQQSIISPMCASHIATAAAAAAAVTAPAAIDPPPIAAPTITPQPEAVPESEKLPGLQMQKHSQKPIALSKAELLDLVGPDPYEDEDGSTVEDHLRFVRDPYMRGYTPADGPDVIIAHRKDEVDFPSNDEVRAPNDDERQILWDLRFAVVSRLRSPHKVDLDTIYDIYQRLPEPRIPYIHGRLRHQLLKALGQPRKRDSKSMMRYFAVVADVKDSGIPLTTSEWNCAISYASRYVGVTSEVETESALKLWREMEQDAGVRANDVTFNILFDAASKSGNFVLAEMIYKEMEARGHRFNRYHYVSLIHFFGLKLDTSGMRAAYREMVHAGEMIDTVALNAVLSGLLRSGEEAAAERVYARMKASVTRDAELPARTYATDRAITKALLMFSKLGRKFPAMRPRLQSMAFVHPDLHTYRILINHYGAKAGDLAKVAQFVDEMKMFQIPLHGAIFLALFKGFTEHGGFPRSPWSEQRLGNIWDAFLQAVDDGVADLEIKTWLAVWILRAFARCSTRHSVLEAYDELKARWRLDFEDEQFMVEFLGNLVAGLR